MCVCVCVCVCQEVMKDRKGNEQDRKIKDTVERKGAMLFLPYFTTRWRVNRHLSTDATHESRHQEWEAVAETCTAVAIGNRSHHSPTGMGISGKPPTVHRVTMQRIRAT